MAKLNKDLEQAVKNVDLFNESVTNLTLDELSKAPKVEVDPQVKMSNRELAAADGMMLKPDRSINSKELFIEKFRAEYNFKKEYVPFMAENHEIIGDTIEIWTKPFPGMSAEFWKVPANKKVWGPRYLAEQISRKGYTRLVMEDRATGQEGGHTFYGQLAASSRIQRLDARPARGTKSVSMSSEF